VVTALAVHQVVQLQVHPRPVQHNHNEVKNIEQNEKGNYLTMETNEPVIQVLGEKESGDKKVHKVRIK